MKPEDSSASNSAEGLWTPGPAVTSGEEGEEVADPLDIIDQRFSELGSVVEDTLGVVTLGSSSMGWTW